MCLLRDEIESSHTVGRTWPLQHRQTAPQHRALIHMATTRFTNTINNRRTSKALNISVICNKLVNNSLSSLVMKDKRVMGNIQNVCSMYVMYTHVYGYKVSSQTIVQSPLLINYKWECRNSQNSE